MVPQRTLGSVMLDHAGPFLVQGKFTDIISLKNVLSLDKPRPEVARFSFRDWKTKRQVTMDDFTLTMDMEMEVWKS